MSEVVEPRLSATVLLVRDGAEGLELFMVARHHQIEFASGALVFPGGSLDPTDSDPRLRALSDGLDGASDEDCRLKVGAAREAFEECGVLLARPDGSNSLVDGRTAAALGDRYRVALEAGEIGMADIAEKEGLRLALDHLIPFAHWITPAHMPKRFDTHFFVAAAPDDHALAHDGREAVDSVWITPARAIADAEAGRRTVIFPTRLNIAKIDRSTTVSDLLARCRTEPVVTVLPTVTQRDGQRIMHIPIEAGYGAAEFMVERTKAGAVPIKSAP
jgi:8-oxo-dGTP pyrophosphatase MutT (NUDIX family)